MPHPFVVRKAGVGSNSTQSLRLPDLRHVRDANRLLDVLGQFVVNETRWTLSAEEAAVSLHFLNRAARRSQISSSSSTLVVRRRQSLSEGSAARPARQPVAMVLKSPSNRLDTLMVVLSSAVAQGIRRSALEPKYLSMSLTALADRMRHHRVYQEVFQLASKSIQGVAQKSAGWTSRLVLRKPCPSFREVSLLRSSG